MIAPKIIAEIRRLLAEKMHAQREIAQLTGVSRGTVRAISRGRRTDRVRLGEEELERPAGPPRRCPGCGGKVYMPCLLCRAREEYAKNRRVIPQCRKVIDCPPTGLELRPEHYARYLQVCAWRRENQGRPFRGSTS